MAAHCITAVRSSDLQAGLRWLQTILKLRHRRPKDDLGGVFF